MELEEGVLDRPHKHVRRQRGRGDRGAALLAEMESDVIHGLRAPGQCWAESVCSTWKCSTIGPRARAGKNCSPPMIKMTPTSRPTKSGPSVGKVPPLAASFGLAASAPAIASTGIT